MSSDDGIYVWVSRGRRERHGYGKEYRVNWLQGIDHLERNPNYPAQHGAQKLINRQMLEDMFGDARVFTDQRVAQGYAECLHDQQEWTEYGIVFIYDFADFPFPQRQKRTRRRPRRLRAVS